MIDDLLTTGQAAKVCCVTPDTVLKWIKSSKIPASRTIGGHYRVRRSDLSKLVPAAQPEAPSARAGRQFEYCWEFRRRSGRPQNGCLNCLVYRMRARRCYEMARVPPSVGPAKIYCETSCEQCDYYRAVKEQSVNVLVVSDDATFVSEIEAAARCASFNLKTTDCEYNCSMLVDAFRPDYVVIDCAMGKDRSEDFVGHLKSDPRIPWVRLILAGEPDQVPQRCDRSLFARIERPVSIEKLEGLLRGLSAEYERNAMSETSGDGSVRPCVRG